jgi:hypothetical protein
VPARGPATPREDRWLCPEIVQTPPVNIALRHVKLNTFGVPAGKPIMDLKTHPHFAALKDAYDGDADPSALFVFEIDGVHLGIESLSW